MDAEENLKSKKLYKIQLYTLKIIPMIMAFISLLNSILSYVGVDLPILSYIGGCSIVTVIFIYLSSYVFHFCRYHRMFLHYIVVTWIINIIDLYLGIPISNLGYLCLQMIIAGICLFIILYLYVKDNKRSPDKNSR